MTETLSFGQKVKWVVRRVLRLVLILFFGWLAVILIGLIPTNNDFVESVDGVEIMVISNPVHADIILPIRTEDHDWAEHFSDDYFPQAASMPTHVAIGWGDKGFYINTPTWAEFKVSTAAYALFWASSTCVHVEMFHLPEGQVLEGAKSVKVSREQYEELVSFVLNSFKLDENGDKIQIENAHYSQTDAFFEAQGTYHLFNTCNSWVGRGLRNAEVRTGIMTPLPGTPTLYFPDR